MKMQAALRFDKSEIQASIAARFDRVSALVPNLQAVKSQRYSWTYAYLRKKADQIAYSLIESYGTGAEPIALLLDHDAPLIASILGVLKAGKFYAVLDPAYPNGYLSDILKNLGARVLVTDSQNFQLSRTLISPGCDLIVYEGIDDHYPELETSINLSGDMPLAIYFTSGSTGRSKGVIRSQSLTLHRTWFDRQQHPVYPDDRQTLLTSCSFASSPTDIFNAVLNGCTLSIYKVRDHVAGELKSWINHEGITLLHPPIAYFRYFIGSLDQNDFFPSIRQVTLTGDVLFRKDIENAWKHFSKECTFAHCLASSEAGLISKMIITNKNVLTNPIISIGYPVDGREIWIMDDSGKRLDSAQTGRIGIRSPYLSSGYWNLPEETAKHFFQDPEDPSQRFFLSGDLGRIKEDGTLEVLGREDAVVKVRGYRVDLAVIEAALLETDDYREIAVLATSGPDGEKQIAAYLVHRVSAALDEQAVRSDLAKKLPEYMLPSTYSFLEMLPRLPNGKVDRLFLAKYQAG